MPQTAFIPMNPAPALPPGSFRKSFYSIRRIHYDSGYLQRRGVSGAKSRIRRGSLTAFERLCDDTLTAYFAKARTVVFGEQVVTAYLCALETEIAAARMIVNGLQIGLPADTIRTRLRELYF